MACEFVLVSGAAAVGIGLLGLSAQGVVLRRDDVRLDVRRLGPVASWVGNIWGQTLHLLLATGQEVLPNPCHGTAEPSEDCRGQPFNLILLLGCSEDLAAGPSSELCVPRDPTSSSPLKKMADSLVASIEVLGV